MYLWDVASGKAIGPHQELLDWFYSMAYSPDGKTLAAAGIDKVWLWDTATSKVIRQLEDHGGSSDVHPMVFAPDGKVLASGGLDNIVRLWDVAGGKQICQFQGNILWGRVLHPLGMPSPGEDKTVGPWEAAGGKVIRKLPVRPKFNGPQDVTWLSEAISPDGKTVASAYKEALPVPDRTVRLWELASGKETCQLQPERFAGPLSSFHFSPDGKTLAAAASDNSVRLFDVASGKEIRQFQGHEKPAKSLAFSPDGKILASASSDTTVRLWDTAGGKEIRKLEVRQGNVLSVAYSPDGRTFASAAQSNRPGLAFGGGMRRRLLAS